MNKKSVYNLVLAAMFLSLGIVFPQAVKTIPVPNIGSILLPMHIPVLLCGFICGYKYGLAVGAAVPLISSLFGMPPLYPVAVSMALELSTYGFAAGILNKLLKNKIKNSIIGVYVTLIGAMLAGRIIMGIANPFLYGIGKYGLKVFIAGAFIDALPGIIIQLTLIPLILISLKAAKMYK